MKSEQLLGSAWLRRMGFLAVFVATTVVLSPTLSGAQTKSSQRAIFSYSCCSASVIDAVHHPGEVLKISWTRSTNPPTSDKKASLTYVLTATISGPFATVAALKTAFGRSRPRYGVVNSSATVIRVPNSKDANPVSMIRIPANAGNGFYELTTSVSGGSVTSTGGSVIRVSH